jgi:hypothetical protein
MDWDRKHKLAYIAKHKDCDPDVYITTPIIDLIAGTGVFMLELISLTTQKIGVCNLCGRSAHHSFQDCTYCPGKYVYANPHALDFKTIITKYFFPYELHDCRDILVSHRVFVALDESGTFNKFIERINEILENREIRYLVGGEIGSVTVKQLRDLGVGNYYKTALKVYLNTEDYKILGKAD